MRIPLTVPDGHSALMLSFFLFFKPTYRHWQVIGKTMHFGFSQLRSPKMMVTRIFHGRQVLEGGGQIRACGEGNDAYRHACEAVS